MDIPEGLTVADELDITGRLAYRAARPELTDWLIHLRPEWRVRADLTFDSLAAPERCEKAVRSWLRDIAPGAWAIVGYERQERGAMHAHVILDAGIDCDRAQGLWTRRNGFCHVNAIRNQSAALVYAIKHAAKGGDVDVYGPGRRDAIFSTGEQLGFGFHIGRRQENPNDREAAAIAELSGKASGAGDLPAAEPHRRAA